jgi:hypothetical protein
MDERVAGFLAEKLEEWTTEPITEDAAVGLAGGAVAALVAFGYLTEAEGQEWLLLYQRRAHDVRISGLPPPKPMTVHEHFEIGTASLSSPEDDPNRP